MKARLCIGASVLLWLGITSSAFAVEYPKAGSADGRIRYVAYEPGNITDIWTAPGAALTVQFSKGEEVVSVAESDSKFLKVVPVKNYLFIKPTGILPPQPITVLCSTKNGELRPYVFQFETVNKKLGAGQNVDYEVIFTYPHQELEEALAKRKIAEAKAKREAARARLRKASAAMASPTASAYDGARNYEYVARGNRTLAPSLVWDNGYSTVFTFPAEQRIPAIFSIQPDGKEASVNDAVYGDTTVIQGTAPEWLLRDGHTVLAIYDLKYNSIGATPGTHTISPDVRRALRTAQNGD